MIKTNAVDWILQKKLSLSVITTRAFVTRTTALINGSRRHSDQMSQWL